MTTDIISFDFDSSISDTGHRQHMIDRVGGTTDWGAYAMECLNDGPGPALPLAQYLSKKREPFIIVSGRAEIARVPSMQWLHKRDVFPWAMFLCDERHNYMSHAKWKALRLKEIQEQNDWNILFHVEDVDSVGREVTDTLGIPVMMVHTIGQLPDNLG